jgi:hypothetical protein
MGLPTCGELSGLLAVIESSRPDLASLITPVKDLWTVVTGLVTDAAKLTPAQIPQAPSLGVDRTDEAGKILREANR